MNARIITIKVKCPKCEKLVELENSSNSSHEPCIYHTLTSRCACSSVHGEIFLAFFCSECKNYVEIKLSSQ